MRLSSSATVRPGSIACWPLRTRLAGLAGAVGCAALAACSPDTTGPIGHGNDVVVDVDGSEPVAVQDEDADTDDSPFAPLPDAGYGPLDAGSSAAALCEQCGCEAGTFCFGGSESSPASACGAASGLGASSPAVGCNPVPAECDGGDDCACLLQSIAPGLSCYPVCEGSTGTKLVFCPH